METPLWTDREWDLARELLERRSNELAVEIRHTSTREMKERLREQLDTVNTMLEKARSARAAAAG